MTNVLVEGGGRVLGSFVDAGLADEAHIFVAAKLIGGEEAPGPLRHIGPATMQDLPALHGFRTLHFGQEICYTARFGPRPA
jgi:diaminohydroxyphosphoribosylaminopyrimidine deaminase/5-amino-6-(5-phosphoribosylamino)uracil reductase